MVEFDKKQYKIYTWKSLGMLHWILNPILVLPDLIVGHRVAKINLEDKTIDKPRFERSFVPCPYCHKLHDARIWAPQNKTATKNWFGLYCPNCGKIIPCLTNILSFIILCLSFPIWGWFRKGIKEKWLKKQAKRYENIDIEKVKNPFGQKNWLKTAMFWALFMYVFMTFLYPLMANEEITLTKALVAIPIWVIAGLAYGYTMKLFYYRKN